MKYYALQNDFLTPAVSILASLSKIELTSHTITQQQIHTLKDNFPQPGFPPYLETQHKNLAGFKDIFLFLADNLPPAAGLSSAKEEAENLVEQMLINLLPSLEAVDQYLGIAAPNKLKFTSKVKEMKIELQKLNRIINLRPFIFGFSPSIADILLVVMLTPAFTHLIGPALQSEFSGVVDYYFRAAKLPYFQALTKPSGKLESNKLPAFPEQEEEKKESEAAQQTVALYGFVIDKPKKNMIYLHGLTGYGTLMKNWLMLPEFTNRRRIYVPDLRNHGKSVHTNQMSYPLMAYDVLRYADENGLDTFTLMGHSMGGKIAATVAQIAPERLDGVLILDAPLTHIGELEKSTPPERRLNIIQKVEWARTFDIESSTSVVDAVTKLAKHLNGDLVLAKRMSINIVPHQNGKHMKWQCNMKAICDNYPMAFEEFNPYHGDDFIILVGEKSFEFNVEHYKHIFPTIEVDRHVRIIKSAAHNLFVDNQKDTNLAICEFLDRIDGAQP